MSPHSPATLQDVCQNTTSWKKAGNLFLRQTNVNWRLVYSFHVPHQMKARNLTLKTLLLAEIKVWMVIWGRTWAFPESPSDGCHPGSQGSRQSGNPGSQSPKRAWKKKIEEEITPASFWDRRLWSEGRTRLTLRSSLPACVTLKSSSCWNIAQFCRTIWAFSASPRTWELFGMRWRPAARGKTPRAISRTARDWQSWRRRRRTATGCCCFGNPQSRCYHSGGGCCCLAGRLRDQSRACLWNERRRSCSHSHSHFHSSAPSGRTTSSSAPAVWLAERPRRRIWRLRLPRACWWLRSAPRDKSGAPSPCFPLVAASPSLGLWPQSPGMTSCRERREEKRTTWDYCIQGVQNQLRPTSAAAGGVGHRDPKTHGAREILGKVQCNTHAYINPNRTISTISFLQPVMHKKIMDIMPSCTRLTTSNSKLLVQWTGKRIMGSNPFLTSQWDSDMVIMNNGIGITKCTLFVQWELGWILRNLKTEASLNGGAYANVGRMYTSRNCLTLRGERVATIIWEFEWLFLAS